MKQSPNRANAFFILAAVVSVFAVGFVDYATGREITFSVFYLLAVGMAAWFVNRGFAIFISVLSVVVSVAGDLASGARYPNPLVPIWNAFILLTFYLVVVWLLARLRSLHNELEARVKLRTNELTEQMGERERLERELLEVSDREQRRIGQDLHDSLCQHLTGTALAGQVLEEKLAMRNVPEAADASKVVELVEEGIALSRKLAKGLHPIEMEAGGLMQALEELAANTGDLFKVSCRFECDSPVLIHDVTVSGHLYRIAQEAISNAIKHGKAKNIVIYLEALDEGITLRVQDDGVGLPEPLPAHNEGMGLRIMDHRASMIGAVFSARRGTAGGTVVTCTLRQENVPAKGSRE
ncbi:MAG TPA: sensor histidine kinase [Verrucomicrobiae bacterium]|jgi:signal transduction histidine kinase|nr:sensor histidine kinase [Verrucomicrobiae bacterium]